MKYTVKRSEWYRGQGDRESRLLRNDGTRCCLGFVGKQCGYADELLRDEPFPAFVEEPFNWPRWLLEDDYFLNSDDCSEAARINDDPGIDEETREAKLKEMFAKHGDELEFVP